MECRLIFPDYARCTSSGLRDWIPHQVRNDNREFAPRARLLAAVLAARPSGQRRYALLFKNGYPAVFVKLANLS